MSEELKQLREALRRVKHEAASLADAQVIALEALTQRPAAQAGEREAPHWKVSVEPVAVSGEDDAHCVRASIGNQSFHIGPDYMDTKQEAEFFAEMFLHAIEVGHRASLPTQPAAQAMPEPSRRPLFAASVAARKWAELQSQGHRMQALQFDGGPGGAGAIDPWGKVTWATPEPDDEGPEFTVGDPDLNNLLNLAADMAKGRCNHDTGMAWLQALEAVEARMTATPTQQAAGEPIKYQPGEWYEAKDRDDLEAFFRSRLPAIREAAREHGYAIGVHGSMRRDLDLIAAPWRDGASDKDVLAHAIAMAACGITRDGPHQWEQKPLGRVAASLPCCWPRWFNEAGAGHIDLSVVGLTRPAPGVPDFANLLKVKEVDWAEDIDHATKLEARAKGWNECREEVLRLLAAAQAKGADHD